MTQDVFQRRCGDCGHTFGYSPHRCVGTPEKKESVGGDGGYLLHPDSDARRRWARVRSSRSNGAWQGKHPLLELYEELLDAQNYAELARREGLISKFTVSAIKALALSISFTLRYTDKDMSKWDAEVPGDLL